MDFGLAKLLPESPAYKFAAAAVESSVETAHSLPLGTMAYMSPEQVRCEAIDYRSDLFSLGAVLYEMLTGKKAVESDSSEAVRNAILTEDPPDLPAASVEMDRIVRRCLEKEPARRIRSARELRLALTSYMRTGPSSQWNCWKATL